MRDGLATKAPLVADDIYLHMGSNVDLLDIWPLLQHKVSC